MKKPVTMLRCVSALMMLAFALTLTVPVAAEEVVLKKGTDVHLLFDSHLSSKTAKPGDKVWFHVETPVQVDSKTVIKEGTKVSGTVVKVSKRGRYGVNARIQLKMGAIRTVSGKYAALGFKTKGQEVGSRTGEAAGATIGGAVVLGPVGLVGGYFIVGKQVTAKPGDKITVVINKDMAINVR